MCQLTLICSTAHGNRGPGDIVKTLMYGQLFINSSETHQDGFGIYNRGSLYKSVHHPYNITNLGDVFKPIFTKDVNIAIGHVRKATIFGGKKEITKDLAHPFETESIILAHNGSLSFVNANKEKEFLRKNPKIGIDSHMFAEYLSQQYKVNEYKDFVKVLEKVVLEFEGKFAFMIHDKVEDKFYIARGNAPLYQQKTKIGKETVLIVNTEEKPLCVGSRLGENILQLTYGYRPAEVVTEPEIVKAGTIFEVDEETCSLIEVGKCPETTKTWPATVAQARTAPITTRQSKHTKVSALADIIMEIREVGWLTFTEIDVICMTITGFPLMCTPTDLLDVLLTGLTYIMNCANSDGIEIMAKNSIDFTKLPFPAFIASNDEISKAIIIKPSTATTGG